MSVSSGPSLNTSGLVLELDVANPKSYSYSENLLRYSQQMDIGGLAVSSWDKTRCNYTGNVAIAPDGTLTAGKLYDDSTATATHYLNGPGSGSYANSTILPTGSIYVKAAEKNLCGFYIVRDNGSAFAVSQMLKANLTNGTIQSGPGTITPASNGWYRISGTATSSGTNYAIRLELLDPSGNVSYTGDGVSGIYIWGGQLERNSEASNYTPTANTPIQASNTWTDLSLNKNNGTLSGSTIFNANTTFNFDGASSSCSLPLSSLPTGNTISISFWTNNLTTAYTDSIIWAGDSGNFRILNIHHPWNNGVVYFDCGRDSTYDRISTPSGLTTPQLTGWHNWVFTKNATTGYMAMYLDGALLVSGTGNYRPLITPTYFFLGSSTGAQYWSGTLGNFSMYNIELTPDQIIQNFNAYRGRYGL